MLTMGFELGGRQRSGDRVLGPYLQRLAQNDFQKADALHSAALTVARKLPQVTSIDALLSLLMDENAIEIAKMAIVLAIARAEAQSIIFRDDGRKYDVGYFGALSRTWYGKLFEILHQRVPVTKVDTIFDNLSVISFNYDRSLEHFLFRAIRNLYDLSDEAAAEALSGLSIIHPYGQISPLPWQVRGAAPYGSAPALEKAALSIRTFSEQIAEPALQKRIHELIEDSERVILLGFGFIDENMEILKPPKSMKRKPLRGTAFGFSPDNRDHVQGRLREWFGETGFQLGNEIGIPAVRLESISCSDYLDQFSRFISA